jgi:hypothetical protein
MSGADIERLLALLDDSQAPDDIVRYVLDHRVEILKQLEEHGEATIPAVGGDIVLRKAA